MNEVVDKALVLVSNPVDDEAACLALIARLDDTNAKLRAEGNAEAANDLWRLATALRVKQEYLCAFRSLKEGRHMDAWRALERCEIETIFLIKNSTVEFQRMAHINTIAHYVRLWQSLFPYSLFASPGFLIGHHTCSICGQKVLPSSACSHQKGKLYAGQLCLQVAHDIELMEVSLVKNPVQKYSVFDLDYDYRVVNFVLERLLTPFDGWNVSKTTRSYPREAFASVQLDARCPCQQSDLTFGDCCAKNPVVSIPHLDIAFEIPFSSELSHEVFPF
jgi:hypothetical protein